MTAAARQRGFTLLEIIIVVLVFGVMSAMAYGGLNSVLKMRRAVEQSMSRTAECQKAYMRLRNDFQNLANRPVRDNFGDSQPALKGSSREQFVEFTRGGWRNPLYLPRGSFERVAYALKDGNLERASYRVLDRAQDSQPVRLVLLAGVEALHWRYLDKNREWVEDWPGNGLTSQPDPEAPPPLAVELVMTTRDLGKLRLLFKPGLDDVPAKLQPASASSTSTDTNTNTNSQSSDRNQNDSESSSGGESSDDNN